MVGDILQPTHLLFVLVIALLVLGPKRLPEVGQKLGSGIRDFRSAINGESPTNSMAQQRTEPETIYAPPAERHQPPREPEPAAYEAPAASAPVADASVATEPHTEADDDGPTTAVALEDAPSAADAPPPLSLSSSPAEPPPHSDTDA